MSPDLHRLGVLRPLGLRDLALIVTILVACSLVLGIIRAILRRNAEKVPSHQRLLILRIAPFARLVIGVIGAAIIIPILVEPTFDDIVALLAAVVLGLAFALKDYLSSFAAGLMVIFENAYQPGDWIEIDGAYGEVKTIGRRAVRLRTSDETEILVPHNKLWSTSLSNASCGSPSLLCIANFYLRADHDGAAVSQMLVDVAQQSPFLKTGSRAAVSVSEVPWGTWYRLKAHVRDSREQSAMITDLTIRGKARLRAMHVDFAQVQHVAEKPLAT